MVGRPLVRRRRSWRRGGMDPWRPVCSALTFLPRLCRAAAAPWMRSRRPRSAGTRARRSPPPIPCRRSSSRTPSRPGAGRGGGQPQRELAGAGPFPLAPPHTPLVVQRAAKGHRDRAVVAPAHPGAPPPPPVAAARGACAHTRQPCLPVAPQADYVRRLEADLAVQATPAVAPWQAAGAAAATPSTAAVGQTAKDVSGCNQLGPC